MRKKKTTVSSKITPSSDGVVGRRSGKILWLLKVKNQEIFKVDGLIAKVFMMVDGKMTLDEIKSKLKMSLSPEEKESVLNDVFAQLKKHGLIKMIQRKTK